METSHLTTNVDDRKIREKCPILSRLLLLEYSREAGDFSMFFIHCLHLLY